MILGIDLSRAFLKERTGIEEYSFQLANYFLKEITKGNHNNLQLVFYAQEKDLKSKAAQGFLRQAKQLSCQWSVKAIPLKYLWTQLGLAWEMLVNPVDVLLVPAHIVPWVHPSKTIVVVHGLEYERCPDSYSFFSRYFHRLFIKKGTQWATRIIAVSNNTRRDLQFFYGIDKEKISVVYNGVSFPSLNISKKLQGNKQSFLLFIGRLEERKNLKGIITAFEILKKKYGYTGELKLAGKPGYGYQSIQKKIESSKFKKFIKELGYVTESQKQKLLRETDALLFPSLCEGFGLPVLEAQATGIPVITSIHDPLKEIAGQYSALVDPNNPMEIAEMTNYLIKDRKFRKRVIKEGRENLKRFSWKKCAQEVLTIVKNI